MTTEEHSEEPGDPRTGDPPEAPSSSTQAGATSGEGEDPTTELLREALKPEFEVLRSIGRGRMARVYLAREVELHRLVAVKVLRRELSLQEAPRTRFLREARSAARISHPNVVAIHRVGALADDTPYLIMEYIDGRTLEDVVAADGPRGEEEVRTFLEQMSGALQAAHDQDIIHRDVRPNNIMRARSGDRYVLTDFGVAGIRETGGEAVARLTGAGEILGDVRYTAPEQFEGNPVRPESDIYALAVTAYEVMVGEDPYGVSRVADVIEAHLKKEPRPLSRLRPGVSPDLEDLLLRCLAKRPEHRPPARDIAKRLSGAGLAAGAEGGTFHAFLQELKRRKVYQVGAGYAAFAVVTLGVMDALDFLFSDLLYRTIVMVVLAGFPVTLILAWVYDLTAGGIERTASVDPSADGSGARVLQIGGVVVSLVLVFVLGWLLLR